MYQIGECVLLWLLAKVAARLHVRASGAPSYSTQSDGPSTPCATPRGEISPHRRVRSRRSRGQTGKPGGASPGDGGGRIGPKDGPRPGCYQESRNRVPGPEALGSREPPCQRSAGGLWGG